MELLKLPREEVWNLLCEELEKDAPPTKDLHILYYADQAIRILNAVECRQRWTELLSRNESEQYLEEGAMLIAKVSWKWI